MGRRAGFLAAVGGLCFWSACSAGPLAHVCISPGMVCLLPGGQQQFRVIGLDSGGGEVPVPGPVAWAADAAIGSITPDGLFTATNVEGAQGDAVRAAIPGGLSGLAIVRVYYPPDADDYLVARAWGNLAPGRLYYPRGLAFDSAGSAYVADSQNGRVQKFDSLGNCLTASIGYGLLSNPADVAVDASDNLYVAEAGNDRVQKFDASGGFLAKWGDQGLAQGQFRGPDGIAIGPDGGVYVMDMHNERVVKSDQVGNLITSWGSEGAGIGQFRAPAGIAVDTAGRVYVAEMINSRVQKFDGAGSYLTQWGARGSQPGQIWLAEDVAVDARGSVYVADLLNNRIQKFAPLSPASARSLADGEAVSTYGQIVTAGTSEVGDCFYMESPDRSGGIRVAGQPASRDTEVCVDGAMATTDGEREIRASSVSALGPASAAPLCLNNRALGGGASGLQEAVWGWRWVPRQGRPAEYRWVQLPGLSNIGLLVTTGGRVTSVDQNARRLLICDGSDEPIVCVAPDGAELPAAGGYVVVTGISSCERDPNGCLVPVLRTRGPGDVMPIASD